MAHTKYYVVYKLNKVMGSDKHLALELVDFDGVITNNFKTKKEAIQALIKDGKTYEDYVILRQIYIRS